VLFPRPRPVITVFGGFYQRKWEPFHDRINFFLVLYRTPYAKTIIDEKLGKIKRKREGGRERERERENLGSKAVLTGISDQSSHNPRADCEYLLEQESRPKP